MKSLGASLLVMFFSAGALASAPQVKQMQPGYYRFMVGDIEVTALLDGTFPMKPGEILKEIKPTEIDSMLKQAYEGPAVVNSVNGFLVNTGSKLVLIDTGFGPGGMMGPGTGHLVENMKASGYKPEQVDEVYITHMHGDHIGGLVTDGKPTFPNAVMRVDKHEADYWLSDAEAAKAPNEMMKSFFDHAKTAAKAYQTAGHFKPFDGETELVPGVKAHPAYGHTVGHSAYTVESNGKRLWLMGDIIHVAAVQFPKPAVTIAWDWDQKKAAAVRAKDFAEAAKGEDLIAAAHLPFPGVGHIKKSGSGYQFTPLAYGWGTANPEMQHPSPK